jgi:hypothetical protein
MTVYEIQHAVKISALPHEKNGNAKTSKGKTVIIFFKNKQHLLVQALKKKLKGHRFQPNADVHQPVYKQATEIL